MALADRIRLRLAQDHVRDVLRTNLNTEITAANVELTAEALTNVSTISDTTAQIQIGDHPDYEPTVYPMVRVGFAQVQFLPITSSGVTDSKSVLFIALYLEVSPGEYDCADDLVDDLHEQGAVYLEVIRSTLEQYLPSADFGDRIEVIGWEARPEDTPQHTERADVLRMRYELTLEWWMRVRHSRNA